MVERTETARLSLRRFSAQDEEAVMSAMQDSQIAAMIPRLPWPYKLNDAAHFIHEVAANQPLTFAVDHSGALVGAVSVEGQLGYWLTASARGQGFATEASQAVLALHFDAEGTDVPSGHRLGNTASRNVLVKLGFQDTEQREIYSNYEGNSVTLQDMVLSKDRWEALQ